MKLVKFLLTPPIAAISVALFAALSSFGDPIYVSTFDELKNAVDNAQGGEEIVMAKTTFVQTSALTVKQAITLRGAGENWETVIDGNKAQNMSVTAAGAKLHNFTITNMGGQWAGTAGINMKADSTISNLVVRQIGNLWTGASDGTRFPLAVSAGLVTHCWITNNVMPGNAGINLSGSSKMENCYIADNIDRGCQNAYADRIGVVIVGGSSIVRNCTIVNNKSTFGGLRCASTNAKIYNNIIWGNYNDTGTGNWSLGTAGMSMSGWKSNCTMPIDGMPDGNIDDDPLLLGDNLHFFSTSPCRGTADATLAPPTDIKGVVRGEKPSMGCLEYEETSGFSCLIKPSATYVEQPGTILLSVMLDGSYAEPLSYVWDFNGDGDVDSTEAQPALEDVGKYHVSVVITDKDGNKARASFADVITVAPEGGFVVYVSPTGNGTDPYAGFATGFSRIEDALAFAAAGETVLLDKKTFALTSALTIEKPITLCGAGENWETVLDGQNANRQITVKTSGALLHSFTFTRIGVNNSGSIGLTMTSDSIVSNVVARQNGNNWTGASQNARFVWTISAGLVTHCWSTNNIAPANAGFTLSGGTLENCYIADNIDRGCQNSNKSYIGIVVAAGSSTVRNCTIVNNQCAFGGIYYTSVNAKVYNNIIWGNTQVGSSEVNNWVFEGALSQGNWKGNCTTPLCGTEANGNIKEDPLLQEDQMHFFSTSPCRGTAVAELAPEFDMEGQPRGEKPSKGAFEYVSGGLACTISASATTVDQPETVTLSVAIDGDVTEPIRYEWDLVGDGTVISTSATPTLSAIGLYFPRVKVTDADGKTATAVFTGSVTIYGAGGAVYVTPEANPNACPPYATRATAAANITDALAYAQSGKDVLLDPGTYYISDIITIAKGITVRGVNGPEETFIANTNNTKKIFNLNATGAVVEGITIRDGRFLENAAGAIIHVSQGSVRNCHFINNLSCGHGAVEADGSMGAVFERLVFRGNCMPGGTHRQGPPCLKLKGYNTKVVNCLFECNTNALVEATSEDYGGVAINVYESNAQIVNCTIVSNVSFNARSAAIYNATPDEKTHYEATVRNCVIVGNTKVVDGVTVDSNDFGTRPKSQSNNLVYPSADDYSDFTKVLTVDPQFVDAANGDYHLTATSPAVNGGDNLDYTADSLDLDGKARIYKFGLRSSKADMGCYESPYGQPGLSILVR